MPFGELVELHECVSFPAYWTQMWEKHFPALLNKTGLISHFYIAGLRIVVCGTTSPLTPSILDVTPTVSFWFYPQTACNMSSLPDPEKQIMKAQTIIRNPGYPFKPNR